jgi:hypothetical protein
MQREMEKWDDFMETNNQVFQEEQLLAINTYLALFFPMKSARAWY